MSLLLTPLAHATPEKAASFYEDALQRFERNDIAGTVVQLKNALQEDKRMLAAHLLLGKALLRNGDLKGAEAAFEEALKQGVSRGEVALPLGQIYIAMGTPELVIDRITPAGLPPAMQADILTLRGTAYLESGNARLASESFAEAHALDPKSFAPLIAEIPMLLASGQNEKARATAAKAIELAPNNASAWNMQASVHHATLEFSSAMAAYERALSLEPKHVDARVSHAALLIDFNRDAEAEKDLDFLKDYAPEEPRAAYLRAVIASHQGDSAKAAAALGEAVKQIDALSPAWRARREQLLMVGALAHHALGNWEKALEYLNTMISRNSRNLGAKKLQAAIYVETKDYARALSQLEALQKVIPDDPQVSFLLGSVHLAQRRYLSATELLEKAASRTGSPDMTRMLAFGQFGLGQDQLGFASLEKVFAASPGDGRAGMALVMFNMRQGQPQKALQIAETMVRREPANLTAQNFLGTIKAAAGDKAGARAAFATVLAKSAGFRPAALNLAKLDASEGRFDDARRRLTEMLTKRHNDPDVLFELGLLEQRAGGTAEALRYLQKAAESQSRDTRPALALIDLQLGLRQFDQALATAKDLSAKYPNNVPAQLALGRAYLAVGDPARARSILENATRFAEFDPVLQVTIGRLQLAANNPDGAYYSGQKALQGRPDHPLAMALMVEIETRRGDAAKADAALKALTAKHPNRAETALASANLAMARGQYAAAAAAYRTALTREETTANAINVARAQIGAGETSKAAAFLEGWVKNRPNDLTALKALAETQFRAGQLQAARQNYARATAADPSDAATLNNYANLLKKLNDPAAQSHAEMAVKLDPNNPNYADTLGWILVQQGQIDPGLRYLREARLRSPENAQIRFHLAYALSKAGRKAEARDELTAALSGPGHIESTEGVIPLKKELGL